MNKYVWNIALFLIPIAVITAMNLFDSENESVSVLEQRDIRTMPSLTLDGLVDGTFTNQFDNYYADHFIMRESMVETGNEIKSLRGWRSSDGVALVVQEGGNNMSENLGGQSIEEPQAEAAMAQPAEQAAETEGDAVALAQQEEAGQGVVKTEKTTYLVIKDRAMLLYRYSEAAATDYASTLNRLRSALDPKVRLYSLLVPSQVEFIEEEKYRKLNDSQKEAFESVYAGTDEGIVPVPAYANIEAHKSEYLYYRSDHHWTSLGAYYAYEAFIKSTGAEPLSLASYKKREIKDFLGTAYAATLNPAMKKNPDTITTYEPNVKYTFNVYRTATPKSRKLVEAAIPTDGRGGYAVFLGGDFSLGRISTDVKNSKRLLVVKDSYANAIIPFLLPHYAEINIVDPRYYKDDLLKLVKDHKVTDVLVENSPIVTTYNSLAKMIDGIVKVPATK